MPDWSRNPTPRDARRDWAPSHLSVGQKCVHSLQESRIQYIGLIHDKCYLFIFTARASQHRPKILIEVFPGVLPVHLQERLAGQIRSHSRGSVRELRPPLRPRGRRQTHLDLVHAQPVHPGHEAGQSGFSCSADTDQKQVALRLAEYSETPGRTNFKAVMLHSPLTLMS